MEPIPLSQLVIVAVTVCLAFEAGAVYFFLMAHRSKLQDKRFFSDARLGNVAISVFFAIVGILFLIFYIKNNRQIGY